MSWLILAKLIGFDRWVLSLTWVTFDFSFKQALNKESLALGQAYKVLKISKDHHALYLRSHLL